MNRSSFASVAPFYLSSFAWNFALGMTYILIPLYARSLGMSGVQIGTLLALPVILPVVPRMLTVGDIRGHEKVPVCGQVKSLSLACRRVFWARAVTVAMPTIVSTSQMATTRRR